MSELGSDGGGGLTSLQRPCLYQTVIRLILIREYLPPPLPPGNQATGTMAIKNGKLSSSVTSPMCWPLKKTHIHPPPRNIHMSKRIETL